MSGLNGRYRLPAYVVLSMVAPGAALDAGAAKLLYSPDTALHVCAGTDGVLHVIDMTADCPPAQKSLFLKKAQADIDFDQNEHKAPQDSATLDEAARKRVEELEQRVKELEAQASRGELGNRVTAPFSVFDRAGKLILLVTLDREVELFDASGKPTAWITDSYGGGGVFGTKGSGGLTATLSTTAKYAGVKVTESDNDRIDLGRDPSAGTYRLKVFGTSGNMVAGIGEGKDHKTGVAQVADAAGRIKGFIGTDEEGKGLIGISRGDENFIATLTEGVAGGGRLTLFSSGGQTMVEAGVNTSGIGVVRAGPEGFKPGLGVLGLPASFISGKN